MLWYDKYRPASMDQYCWTNPKLKDDVKLWVENPDMLPHLLLVGTSGSGKTSLALLMKTLLGLRDNDFLFIPSSTNNGIGMVTNRLIPFCSTFGFDSSLKMVVLDESERLSTDAQEALRNVIDQFGSHVRFVMTCNEDSSIIDALKTRLTTIRFDSMDLDTMTERLVEICRAEDIDVSEDETLANIIGIAEASYPSMRSAINTLQQSVRGNPKRIEWTSNFTDRGEKLLEFLQQKTFPTNKAQALLAEWTKYEIGHAYRFLYQNLDFTQKPEDALVVIAKYLKRHHEVVFPDIHLCGCLVELHRTK